MFASLVCDFNELQMTKKEKYAEAERPEKTNSKTLTVHTCDLCKLGVILR